MCVHVCECACKNGSWISIKKAQFSIFRKNTKLKEIYACVRVCLWLVCVCVCVSVVWVCATWQFPEIIYTFFEGTVHYESTQLFTVRVAALWSQCNVHHKVYSDVLWKLPFFLPLPPAMKLWQGNVFTPVCLPFCSQGEACTGGVRGGGHAWQRGARDRGHACGESGGVVGLHGRRDGHCSG